MPSCGVAGGTICNNAAACAGLPNITSWDCPICCGFTCPAPAPAYHVINGVCVPSCGVAGGNSCDPTACVGLPNLTSWDCPTCCTVPTCPAPPPAYQIVNGVCTPACGTAGGNSCDPTACAGLPNITSWDCPTCCCVPTSCDNVSCGPSLPDGCGGTKNCGCTLPNFCLGGTCQPSICGALLAASGLPDAGLGCCTTGCAPGSTQAGGPGQTTDCPFCCSSTVGQTACLPPLCGVLLASQGLPDAGVGCCPSGCAPGSVQAGGPGATTDCSYCCSSVVGQNSCNTTPSCASVCAASGLSAICTTSPIWSCGGVPSGQADCGAGGVCCCVPPCASGSTFMTHCGSGLNVACCITIFCNGCPGGLTCVNAGTNNCAILGNPAWTDTTCVCN